MGEGYWQSSKPQLLSQQPCKQILVSATLCPLERSLSQTRQSTVEKAQSVFKPQEHTWHTHDFANFTEERTCSFRFQR